MRFSRESPVFSTFSRRHRPPCLTSRSQQGSISHHRISLRVPVQPNGARGKPLVRATIGISAPFRHYNEQRPHRGLDLAVPNGPVQLPTGLPDRIERTDILGGLIHEYHAVAA